MRLTAINCRCRCRCCLLDVLAIATLPSQVLNGGALDEFAILAMLLAGMNCIPPLLFFIYCFTKGRVMHAAVWMGQLLNGALFASELQACVFHHE